MKVEAISAFMVECIAVRETLRVRERFVDRRVVVETDCEILVQFVQRNLTSGCDYRCEEIVKEII